MKNEEIILHGAGGHAKVVLDCLLEQAPNVIGIFDPFVKENLFGVPILGPYDPGQFPKAKVIIAIGDNRARKRIAAQSAHAFATAIDASAVISRRSFVGQGSMILHRSVIQADAEIGAHVIINTGVQIDHDCSIGDYAHIGPGSVLCGNVKIGEGTFVGAGSVIIPQIKIGKWCIIGAGSVVVRDVPDFTMVLGNPARVVKQLEP